MKTNLKESPREFSAGLHAHVKIKDCGNILLNRNEQVTFVTEAGSEYDVCRKEWGYHATPSVNGRLKKFGFKTVLVESPSGNRYVWLIHRGKEPQFEKYLNDEKHVVIEWLSECATTKCICGSRNHSILHTYEKRPDGETDFKIKDGDYWRQLSRCNVCEHFILTYDLDLKSLYQGYYSESTYGDQLKSTFEKIISLPAEKSDNHGRVFNIVKYLKTNNINSNGNTPDVLDVGSGLCVFLNELKNVTHWNCTALDPDERQAQHAREVVGVNVIHSDFMEYKSDKKFDLITFNKVLEHVIDPVTMLAKAKINLEDNGIIYVELPDGEAAVKDSVLRQEFFVEHYHAFSMSSMGILASKAGLEVLSIERLREPSGKYTLRMFCKQ